ncbi:laminin subunit alpha-3-like isoform X3 [Dunckerocampus dactyliophorus]|uniref:laminin subunit alpha-3-like isoform X3 n=1 Tax=Dunckerocampus dactyliophorus TaxID=161453 RepID=UPI002405D56D|nr:laminin subunit alpha-3-like isoform X3 [Dunckerocampus dactyliophorus]
MTKTCTQGPVMWIMERELTGAHLLLAVFVVIIPSRCTNGQETTRGLSGFSLSPPYFNLALGSRISATATCGKDEFGTPRSDLYCKLVGGPTTGVLTQNIRGQFCDYCNTADPSKAHPVTNAIDGTERWWQSPPLSKGLGYNEVSVTLDLGQLFHVAYIIIKFANSPRPDLWVLERSVDNGRTFIPWQYFAHSKHECIERFGKEPNARLVNDDDQLCTTEYSRIVPLENGEVVVSLINGRPGSKDFTRSTVLQDFTRATNVRLRFLRTNTLLGHLISKAQRDPTVTRRYYYSIKDISIGGRCVCHGHAQVCGAGLNPGNPNKLQCECQHNTCGESCDRCCPGFNQKRWHAATVDNPNECQPCQCLAHATDCYYDPEVEARRASLDIFGRYSGGGVCINCQHNTAGVNCERCIEGFFRPYGVSAESTTGCISCRCDERTTSGCEMGSGRCICKVQYAGNNCEQCAEGHYYYPQCIRYPAYQTTTKTPAGPIVVPTGCPVGYFGSASCEQCVCDYRGTDRKVCDASGHCLCRHTVEGQRCDRCRPGYHSFPNCHACLCDGAGVAESVCSPSGQCICVPNYRGKRCDQCAPGYYGYPECAACQCSRAGSYSTACNPMSGQCLCLPGVAGQQCDRCASGLSFPACSASIGQCNPSGTESMDPQTGSCRCRPNSEGALCDRCKPLYWNLAADNTHGCEVCRCDIKGTLSGVGECEQVGGQCHCKPHVGGHACASCNNGYFLLHKKNYFGCQGCECDIGGVINTACDETSGQCSCRSNIVGMRCTEPALGYYFPTLHQFKFEVEDGTTPNSRPVRFGYDPQEFPEFSWRGYAVLSPAQSEVRVTVHVDPKDARHNLFRVVLRFTNPGRNSVTGSIKTANNRGSAGSEQSKDVVFPESLQPSFLTVPGNGFTEPFSLAPGKWIIHIRAQGVLLDYLVLLPQDYYEAPLLQENVTEPCTYAPTAPRNKNCLLYKHVAMDAFSSASASQGSLSRRGHVRRQAQVRRPTSDHPEMTSLHGRQSQLQLSLRVPHPGPHALVLEYASEVDSLQNVNLLINVQQGGQIRARANVYSCVYSFLCRSVAVDSRNQVAMFHLSHRTELFLQTSTASFLLHKVYAVPAKEFSMEYLEAKVLCISTHGRFTEDSQHCVLRHFNTPWPGWVLHAARDGKVTTARQIGENTDWRYRRQSDLFYGFHPHSDNILLKYPQTEVSFTPKVPLPGRYVLLVHYHQLEHVSYPVEVQVDAGYSWKGSINASFCPSVSGCREVLVADGRTVLDFSQQPLQQPSISVVIPPRKTLILDHIFLVPESHYTPDLVKENPLDKSALFIQQCRGEGFYIDPRTSSQFCRDSARSLVALYNDGALPCNCDRSGSTGSACNPAGGQCPCRPHVIGQRCTKCATGYYGFPYCRPCECGRRLCDEVTGRCVCPPQTVRPTCEVCQNQTFSYHPLLGCEGCDCSQNGIQAGAGPNCDRVSGQCSCRPRIGGRQCNRCAAGYHHFPECVPCDCEQGGVTPDVCHPDTGKCLCKKNVVGIRCDTCQEGSFYFDPSNPNGCTTCFCFGATDQCQSSSKRRGKFVDMRGWKLDSPDHREVQSVLNTASNMVVADVQELPSSVQALHWVAPPSYRGDRVSSYGGFLTYQAKSFGIPSEGMTLMDRTPDVLLTGKDMTLIHLAPQVQLPDRLYQGRVQLVEENWRHAGTNRPVSREQLMMVLAGLVHVRIRALYFSQSQRLSLGDVGMEEVANTGTGGPGNTVEVCSCPPQFTGDSCEKCAPGYFRDGNGPYLGRCVPCNCNGLADECEDWTGRCLNCQYNTAGDRCEYCKEGYYGNAAQRTCQVCPCPFSAATNSFAVACREIHGDIQCICSAGYTGDRCEKCAPGFYGDPLAPGGSCWPCNCHGNGKTCDPKTGVCKNTLEPGDTNTDDRCQECDNCAQTLLKDMEKLDDELARIKAQLDNASASASSQDRLKKLERAVSDTKNLVNKFSSSVNGQNSRVKQLEEDMLTLSDDIASLRDKADKTAVDADKAVVDVEKPHKRAQELDQEIKNMLKKIQVLLDQLSDVGSSGGTQPNENAAKMLDDAQRMVNEMESRNFTPQKTVADKEREEAKKLLDYIKANVSKQSDQNEAAAAKMRDQLKGHEAKLKDLDKSLKDSMDLVKKANVQNGLNAQALPLLLKRVNDLKKERKTVEDQMAMAKNELKKIDDLIKTLSSNKTEYEKLAAQLDGGKTDLTKKVNDISKVAAKEGIVEDAEDHAKNLQKLSKELEDTVKNASGRPEVRNAKDAIDAYKNITDVINAAEAAANEAKDAADKALTNVKKQKLTQRAKDLKETGGDLVHNAQDTARDLQGTANELPDIKRRLKNAEKKKKALERDLLDAQTQLNNIKGDDIGVMIDEAKRKAASANDSATDTMNKLIAMDKEMEKINLTPGNSNFGNVMDDVDKSVKNLLKTIPTLNDKLSEVKNLTFSPLSNITDNIKKIKELIEHARDAANRIAIPMKFTGDSYVQLHPPKNLEDLKAYTALSLSLQRPEGRGDGRRRRKQATDNGDMFVMYLGNKDSSKDYIGMFLRGNVLHGVYKLNGNENLLNLGYITTSASEKATFDKVNLQRIYQDVEMILTKDSASETPGKQITNLNQGEDSKNLLNLTPDDVVFYIGGYPSNFTPPDVVNYPKYKGCIELFSLNNKVVSLYHFLQTENINLQPPCKRYVAPLDSYYLDGSGYGKVNIDKSLTVLLIGMSLLTHSENGLLLYIGSKDNHFAVTAEKGVVYLHSNLLQQPATNSLKTFPASDWVNVLIIITNTGKFTVQIANKVVASAQAQFDHNDFKEYYIGGAPQDLREKNNITIQAFRGCLKNVKLHKNFKPIDEQVGISNGCPRDFLTSRKAEFSSGSSLSADLSGFSLADDVTLSLGFKSTDNQGVLLQNKQLGNALQLALQMGHVVLFFNNKMWTSNKKYDDGKWHYLTVTRRAGRTELVIDDDDVSGEEENSVVNLPDTGGATVLAADNFKGCISNLYTRRPSHLYKAEDLTDFKTSGDVLLDVCTSDSPVQQMLDRAPKKDVMMQRLNERVSATCALPGLVKDAYHMGGPVSRLSYSLPLQVLQPRPHFSVDVRTRSPEGLLFFAATRGGHSHLALYLSKGRIRLSVGKHNEIFNREKYNDGKWHSVMFSLEKKKFRLVVDGIRAQDGQLTVADLASMKHFMPPVFLGSAPFYLHKELKSKSLPKQSVSGCVRNFKMNGAPMLNPSTNHGAGPCFEGQTQKGAYFSGNGAYVIINDSFAVGSSFELLFNIRPRTPTGLLLHVGDSIGAQPGVTTWGHYVSIYLLNGEVVARVNNGKGEFMASVRPKTTLCDGMFHKISVIKRKHVVQLHVDTVDTYKIGPPSSITTTSTYPLYVGGIPADTSSSLMTPPVTSSFMGCIQDMNLNGESVFFTRLSSVFGPVNLKECPG